MALDPELVCPACRRFYHGPAGFIPHWYAIAGYEAGGACRDPRHAAAPELELVVEVRLPIVGEEILVTWLTEDDLVEIRDHAIAVEQYAERQGLRDRNDWVPTNSLDSRLLGFTAEKAVSVFAGEPWNKIIGLSSITPDVGDDIEVKARSKPGDDLPVNPGSNPKWRYVLARGRYPELRLAGWLYGHEALEAPLRSLGFGPTHVTPAAELRPMRTLRTRHSWAQSEDTTEGENGAS